MVSIINALECIFTTYGEKPVYWLGVSGGLDSCVLMHACYELRKKIPLQFHVLHINHGLNPNAKAWEAHCQELCARYDLPFTAISLNLCADNNVEARAREARYRVFAEHIKAGDILLTAHHQDDQAETVLLQLFRGAGPKGLAAMPSVKAFAAGWHARPFLQVNKKQLQAYAQEKKLRWVEDDMNVDLTLARSYIRQQVMPSLIQHWPAIVPNLARSAQHCAEHDALLVELADKELQFVAGSKVNTLSVRRLLQQSDEKQRLLLRVWLSKLGIVLPNTKKLLNMQQTLLFAKADRFPCIIWQGVEIRRFQDDLYLLPAREEVEWAPIQWSMDENLKINGVGELCASKKRGFGLPLSLKAVTVRFREGGERIHLGKRGRKTLKNLFQEWAVVPWQRDRIPLIYDGERLIQVVGYCMDPAYEVGDSKEEGRELTLI